MKVHGWILFAAALTATPVMAKSGLECDSILSTRTVATSSLVLISHNLVKVESAKDLAKVKPYTMMSWWKGSKFESATYISMLKAIARNTPGSSPLLEIVDLRNSTVLGGRNNLGRAFSAYDAKADNNILNQASDGFDKLLTTVYGDGLVEALNLENFKMVSGSLTPFLDLKDGESTTKVAGVVNYNGRDAYLAIEIKGGAGVRNVIIHLQAGEDLKLRRLANLEVGDAGLPELFLLGDKELVLTHRHETQGQSKQALVFSLR